MDVLDALFMVFYIAMAFLPLVAVGLVAWVVVVWLRRGKDGASEDGGSIVRRIYFYVVVIRVADDVGERRGFAGAVRA